MFIQLKNHQDPIIQKLPPENTLYFSTIQSYSFKSLLTHLRSRMWIQWDKIKGVMHYSIPSIASYWFEKSSPEDTKDWLGSFASMWFYSQILGQDPSWQTREGKQSAPVSEQELTHWIIRDSQKNALLKEENKQIQHWAKQNDEKNIDWETQRTLSSFCRQLDISDINLIDKLRIVSQQSPPDFSLLNLNFNDFSLKTDQEKADLFISIMKKEFNYELFESSELSC